MFDTPAPRPIGELHGGETTDFPGQFRIEIAARIVGDARQVNDGVNAIKIDRIGIAHVTHHHGEVGMRFEEITEPLDVERRDLVSEPQQLRHQNAALIAAERQ